MKFIEVKIYTSHEGIEPLTAMLLQKGITEITVDDPADVDELMEHKKEYEWDYIDQSLLDDKDREPAVYVYFDDTEDGRKKVQDLKLAVMMLKGKEMEGVFGWDTSLGRLYAEDRVVDDNDWKDKWKDFFKPVKITENLVIKPTWESYEKTGDEKIIEIDPGMAFGTGTHETTSLCLELIETYLKKGQRVLDIGCGSGILSIGAALLGSGPVLGVEIGPDAVRTARENVQANGVAEIVTIQEGDLAKDVEGKAGLMAANLMAPLVIQLAPAAAQHLEERGVFISSGILLEKRQEVETAICQAGFRILEVREKGEWCAIAAEK